MIVIYIILILATLIIGPVTAFVIRQRKINDISLNYSRGIVLPDIQKFEHEDLQQLIQTNNGTFRIDGNTQRFIINKNNRFEFLVENGRIVACKDNELHDQFIYYEKVN